jgi:hypothetical protein
VEGCWEAEPSFNRFRLLEGAAVEGVPDWFIYKGRERGQHVKISSKRSQKRHKKGEGSFPPLSVERSGGGGGHGDGDARVADLRECGEGTEAQGGLTAESRLRISESCSSGGCCSDDMAGFSPERELSGQADAGSGAGARSEHCRGSVPASES